MKKLLAASLLAATLLLPAASASASEIPQPAGVKKCPPGYIGIIVWVNTAPTGYQEEPFCIHVGP
jgi:hypothetical protein